MRERVFGQAESATERAARARCGLLTALARACLPGRRPAAGRLVEKSHLDRKQVVLRPDSRIPGRRRSDLFYGIRTAIRRFDSIGFPSASRAGLNWERRTASRAARSHSGQTSNVTFAPLTEPSAPTVTVKPTDSL